MIGNTIEMPRINKGDSYYNIAIAIAIIIYQ